MRFGRTRARSRQPRSRLQDVGAVASARRADPGRRHLRLGHHRGGRRVVHGRRADARRPLCARGPVPRLTLAGQPRPSLCWPGRPDQHRPPDRGHQRRRARHPAGQGRALFGRTACSWSAWASTTWTACCLAGAFGSYIDPLPRHGAGHDPGLRAGQGVGGRQLGRRRRAHRPAESRRSAKRPAAWPAGPPTSASPSSRASRMPSSKRCRCPTASTAFPHLADVLAAAAERRRAHGIPDYAERP